jgi:hypothetical protein
MNYKIKVVREPGSDPVYGTLLEYAEEVFDVEANSTQEAHLLSYRICTLPFFGQIRRTYINEIEHLNEKI